MATGKGKGPHPVNPKVVKRLLDGLTTDDAFREKFSKDPKSALESIGYEAPTDDTAHLASCLTMKAGSTLASPEQITAARPKLEATLNSIVNFDCPAALYAE